MWISRHVRPPVHRPAKHVAPAQLIPHAPQFVALVWMSTHASPHAVCPAGHTRLHIPDAHT